MEGGARAQAPLREGRRAPRHLLRPGLHPPLLPRPRPKQSRQLRTLLSSTLGRMIITGLRLLSPSPGPVRRARGSEGCLQKEE